jgi:hypothetical protein
MNDIIIIDDPLKDGKPAKPIDDPNDRASQVWASRGRSYKGKPLLIQASCSMVNPSAIVASALKAYKQTVKQSLIEVAASVINEKEGNHN